MTLNPFQQRLIREITLLHQCERDYGLLAKPVIDQLVRDSDRPLPDVLPEQFQWVKFEWPHNREVNYELEWRELDRKQTKWMGPYL